MTDPELDPEEFEGRFGQVTNDPVAQSIIAANKDEIVLPPAIDGKDRYVSIERLSTETVSPLVKKMIGVESIYEIIDRNFSYPMTAHVGLKFDSRTFSNIPDREYDVKMKKVKVPSNYFPLGGNGLDRRYVYSNPYYPANPTTLDVIFMIDQNMNFAMRSLIKRNLKQFLSKLISGYTNVRASIWQTKSGTDSIVNPQTQETIQNFTFFDTDSFFDVEVPNSNNSDQTNLFQKITDALSISYQISPAIDPKETVIANFFLRKNQFSITDEVGSKSEDHTLDKIWKNTVRKVIYFSASTPEIMSASTYQVLLNYARENCIQFYYLYADAQFSGTRTLRELSDDSGGGSFNMQHDSDIKLQQFCDNNFYDSNKIYYGDWDGTFKIAWTDNPAWVLYDILTDVNYGLGNYIDIYSIDKWTLYDIARYCDAVDDNGRFLGVPDGKGGLEPRYTCNLIFYNKEEAFKVVQEIATIFKGIIYWNTEGFSFFADGPKEPIMYFGNSNVKDGVFNYSEVAKNKRYTSVEVIYTDKYDNFKTKIELIEDPDGIRKFGLNPFRVVAAGCTSRSEARRIGRYVLFASIFESDTVSFAGGLEAAYLQPGDIFAVSDEVRNVGKTFGRVLDVNTSSKQIKIDGEFVNGLASGVYIQIPSGHYSVSDLNNLTGSDGGFTGTLDQIRSRRQKQVRKFNISNVQDDSYGVTLTVTGDFLAVSAKTQVYPYVGRISGAGAITGETVLTGVTYNFPDHTIFDGNPKSDAVSYESITRVFSSQDIDITFSGSAGSGQIIGSGPNWTAEIEFASSSNSTLKINNVLAGVSTSNEIRMFRISSLGQVEASGTLSNLNEFWTNSVHTEADAEEVLIVYTKGNQISNTFSPNNIWSTGASATEIYQIGDDVSASSSSFGYSAAFVKGGYRILERASKGFSETGKIKFSYRDLLAYSKLRPFYTIVQADIGNRQESALPEWQAGASYLIGNKVKVTVGGVSTPYVCTRAHQPSASFSSDYVEPISRECDIVAGNRNIALTDQNFSQLNGISVGMLVAGKGIPENSSVTFKSSSPGVVYFSINKDPTETISNSAVSLYSTASKWRIGNNEGYSTVGFPKDFYGSTKVYTNQTLTASHISGAFNSIGINIHIGGGQLGQSDIANLPESSGIGYNGLIYGTGFPRGYYDLVIDTNPRDLEKIPAGSLYVLSGSGVEPELFKTIAVKEEEANIYSIAGIKYLGDKQDYIEKDILNTSPSIYVQSPYDIVIKPSGVTILSTGLAYNGAVPTGLNISWSASASPVAGYRVYVSRPDYSTPAEGDSISEPYTTASNVTSLAIPINQIWGQYDISVYAQGTLYKFLSDAPGQTGVMVLPAATLSGSDAGGFFAITSTIPTGFTIDTADTNSLTYGIYNVPSVGVAGIGNGNFTSKDLTFRWKYIDPTGGVIDSVERMLQNPFVDLPPNISIQVLDEAGEALTPRIKPYDRFSFTITEEVNKRLTSREKTDFANVSAARNLGLRVVVTDNTLQTKTGTFMAYNIKPSYSRIDVVDSYQDSPYYILSGYFGNKDQTRLAFWGSGVDGILGSGIRNYQNGTLLRSEESSREILYEDISGAFKNATYFDGTTYRTGINITYRGEGSPDYRAYAYAYSDLIEHYTQRINKTIPIEVWASGHYENNGSKEGRQVPKTLGNPLGLSDLNAITDSSKTGFSGITFTVLTEEVSKGELIFKCYSPFSNKDVNSVDIYTGLSGNFVPDSKTNLYKYHSLYKTRSYLNEIRISNDLNTGVWYYFRIVPWDDFGPGHFSNVVSGYLEQLPVERTQLPVQVSTFNGGRNENAEFAPTTQSLTRGYKYQILDLGTSINWSDIGCTTSPSIGIEFIYNGQTVTGSGGRVKRVEIVSNLTEQDLENTILADVASDSTCRLPAQIEEGASATIINRGDKDIYIEDADGRQISVIRPGERGDIVRADDQWYDPRGASLYLER
jgi:hypothetical protein